MEVWRGSGLFFGLVQWCITEECVCVCVRAANWATPDIFVAFHRLDVSAPQHGMSWPICMVSRGPITISLRADLGMRILTGRRRRLPHERAHTAAGATVP